MTLLEVMIALLIASVGLLGALAMLGTLMSGGSYSRAVTDASILAQEKVEDQLALVAIPAVGTTGTDPNIDRFGMALPTGSPQQYLRTWIWSSYTDSLGSTRNRVSVSVAWSDTLGTTHTIYAERERAP
jgi:prepilin-type N-terminal cleavage/methylation domain-containing protein